LGAIPQASTGPAAALGAAKSIMGPPDPAAPKLIEPAAKETAKTANSAPAAAPALALVQEVATAVPTDAKDNAKDLSAKDLSAKDLHAKDLHAKDLHAKDLHAKDLQKDLPKDQDKPVASTEAPNATIQRTEFAIDLGGANSIGGLRALWRGLLKSNNSELAELRPIIVLRESNTGLGMQLRLAAGPLSDAAEAARICASLV